jgi:K(+)-stimulated pyrophosphate-energized sodium pump
MISLLIPLCGVFGLLYALTTHQRVLQLGEGSARMKEIALHIREGASAFLVKESQYLAVFIGVAFLLIVCSLGFSTGLAYLMGSGTSLAASYIGMKAATHANVRTAQAASQNEAQSALLTAFNAGSVMGYAVASLGLLGLGLLLLFYGVDTIESPFVGFGVGATTVALFARVGGGIYTKAADVGADLVGKVEANIPEDDPRNPGVIADNVGDNVGDIAGMGADIFESYVNSLISCAVIGLTMSPALLDSVVSFPTELQIDDASPYRWWLMITPFLLALCGLLGSTYGVRWMRAQTKGEPTVLLRSAMIRATVTFLWLAFIVFLFTPKIRLVNWFSVFFGAACGLGIGGLAEYYTSSKPVRDIVEASKTGPATNIIAGLSVGLRSAVAPLWLISLALFISGALGGIYGVALAAVGMLATTGMVMTIDAFGPIADNAGGICEMSELGPDARAITDKLDAAGNTTAAIGKGFAVCSATLTAISVFGAYAETVQRLGSGEVDLSLTNPLVTIGALIGASLAAIVACLTMTAVGRAAGKMVDEIRRQFREIPGLLEGKEGVKPEVARCVNISTEAALSEMILPGVLSIVIPVLVGFLLGADALGGLLFGTTLVAVVLALFMANAGGAWDNAKKFIEQGLIPGEKKGTAAHKAAVVGDTVGDPFKDTTGPSLNILIKLVAMIALLIAPLL